VSDEGARLETMPSGRSCRYVVVKFGYLVRDESMNVAVLVWEHNIGPQAPVLKKLIEEEGWARIARAFPKSGAEGWVREEVLRRLSEIETVADYQKALQRMGPYTPFEFTEERPSIAFLDDTLRLMAEHFLGLLQAVP